MKFTTLSDFKNEKAQKILRAYTTTFPPEERRSEEQFSALFSTENVSIESIQEHNEAIGYLVLWHLSDFVFVEHFEVFHQYRNRKLGEKILTTLHTIYPKIVLESEPDSLSEIAQRRIHFYQRNGFSIVDKNYMQPSYGEGKAAINLYLLANFIPPKNDELLQEIHHKVYGLSY